MYEYNKKQQIMQEPKFINKWSEFILNETLKNHNIDFVLNHAKEEISLVLPELDFDLIKNKNKLKLILYNTIHYKKVLFYFFNFINNLFIDRNGWFPSSMELKNIYDRFNKLKYDEKYIKDNINKLNKINIIYEPRYDIEINIPDKLYHLSIQEYEETILNKGLSPKNKNKKTIHLDRIYVCKNIENCYDLINQLKIECEFEKSKNDKNKINCKWVLFEIDSSRLNINLYKDPNYVDKGYYIIENIKPELIKIINKEK